MSQTGYSKVQIYSSSTASNTPSASNLINDTNGSELGINITDGKLFYKDNSGTVQVMATKGTGPIGGSNTQVQYNSSGALTGSANLVFTGTNLGIGTSSPSYPLSVLRSGNGYSAQFSNGTSTLSIYNGSTTAYVGDVGTNNTIGFDATSNYVFLLTNNTERMRITSTGNVGIGTSSPSATLNVLGSVSYAGLNVQGILSSSVTYAAGAGGILGFEGQYISANSALANFGAIGAVKANSTSNDYSGNLVFYSRANGSLPALNMTLDYNGNLGLGVTPSAWDTTQNRSINVGPNSSYYGNLSYNNGPNATSIATHAYNTTTAATTGWRYSGAGVYAGLYQFNGTNGQHQWYYAPSGTTSNLISFTQAMTLDSSGNLGLGVSPTAVASYRVLGMSGASGGYLSLQVSGTEVGNIYGNTSGTTITANGSRGIYFYTNGNNVANFDASGNFVLGTNNNGNFYINSASFPNGQISSGSGGAPLILGINGTEKARIDTSGNLLVGVTSSTNTPVSGVSTYNTSSATQIGIGHASGTGSGTGYIVFNYNASVTGSITQSGTTAVLFNVTSDQRLKENIVDAPDASADIDAIKVRSFDFISDKSLVKYGFIAQELLTVAPDAVHQPENPDDMMGVDYSKLVPMMLKEIQSLRARLKAANIA
jgi:hypothetical protein